MAPSLRGPLFHRLHRSICSNQGHQIVASQSTGSAAARVSLIPATVCNFRNSRILFKIHNNCFVYGLRFYEQRGPAMKLSEQKIII